MELKEFLELVLEMGILTVSKEIIKRQQLDYTRSTSFDERSRKLLD